MTPMSKKKDIMLGVTAEESAHKMLVNTSSIAAIMMGILYGTSTILRLGIMIITIIIGIQDF